MIFVVWRESPVQCRVVHRMIFVVAKVPSPMPSGASHDLCGGEVGCNQTFFIIFVDWCPPSPIFDSKSNCWSAVHSPLSHIETITKLSQRVTDPQ